nr:MAG TPA: hypothetical protein [Caudoviricetes sp.]
MFVQPILMSIKASYTKALFSWCEITLFMLIYD